MQLRCYQYIHTSSIHFRNLASPDISDLYQLQLQSFVLQKTLHNDAYRTGIDLNPNSLVLESPCKAAKDKVAKVLPPPLYGHGGRSFL